MKRSAGFGFAVTLALFAVPGLARAEDEEQKPTPQQASLEVVQAYVGKLQAKNAGAALEDHWSFDGLCRGIFGKAFSKLKKDEREETAKIMHEILLPAMTSPQVQDAMANATFEGFEADKPKKGVVQVSFTVTLPLEGAQPTKQYFWVKKVKGEYRIVDMANGDPEAALTKSIGGQYQQHAKELTPLDYARLMKEG